jgi:hypothetical protein
MQRNLLAPCLPVSAQFLPCSTYSSSQKMEAASPSETLVHIYRSRWHHTPEVCNLKVVLNLYPACCYNNGEANKFTLPTCKANDPPPILNDLFLSILISTNYSSMIDDVYKGSKPFLWPVTFITGRWFTSAP